MLDNVAIFTWFPLTAGLFFRESVRLGNLTSNTVAYYLVVFVAFVVALAVNFVGVFGYRRYL